MFKNLESFDEFNVRKVPHKAGVYIIYKNNGQPFYVGRSRISMFDRLWKHLQLNGSSRIRNALDKGERFNFEYQEMVSVEQAEAILIAKLGVIDFGNLRREADPVDWK